MYFSWQQGNYIDMWNVYQLEKKNIFKKINHAVFAFAFFNNLAHKIHHLVQWYPIIAINYLQNAHNEQPVAYLAGMASYGCAECCKISNISSPNGKT